MFLYIFELFSFWRTVWDYRIYQLCKRKDFKLKFGQKVEGPCPPPPPQPQSFLRLCRPSLTWYDLFEFLCFQVKIDTLISSHINFTLACVEMRSWNHQVIRGQWHHLTSKCNFQFPISCWSHRKCQLSWHRVQKAAHLMCQTYTTKCGRWSKHIIDCFSSDVFLQYIHYVCYLDNIFTKKIF